MLGPLFESLVVQSVQVYASLYDAAVHHLRTKRGEHEVDLIVENRDRRVVAIEVKAGRDAEEDHLREQRQGGHHAGAGGRGGLRRHLCDGRRYNIMFRFT